jgi:hypothetical protein
LVAVLVICQAHSAEFSWQQSGPGLAMVIVTNPGPVIFSAVRVELNAFNNDFTLVTTLASNTAVGLETLSRQVHALPKEMGTPVAALNGDFFMMTGSAKGDPRGLHIWRGELVSVPAGPAAFWQDAGGRLRAEPVSSRLTVSWPDGGTHLAGLNEQLGTNSMVLFTPRMGGLYPEPKTNSRPSSSATVSRSNGSVWTNTTVRASSATGASTIPRGGPIRPPGGREWTLEHAGSGPWLPLRVGQTYYAKVRNSLNGFTNVPDGLMLMSLGSNLVATLPAITNGTPVTIGVVTEPDLTGIEHALGTGPLLVHAGEPYDLTARLSEELHPRAALGWDDNHLYLVVADGRRKGISEGARLSQLADFLIDLGCQEAINMDGGQSTTLMLNNSIVNYPMQGREREIANAIVVLRKRAH